MRLEWGHDHFVAPWVATQIGLDAPFGECRAGAVLDRRDNFAAGLVFHNYSPSAGVMEIAGAAIDPKWPQRGVLVAMFDYVFERAGCQMAVARTHPENLRALRIWRSLGAEEHLLPRMRGRDTPDVVSLLTEEAWRASKFAR